MHNPSIGPDVLERVIQQTKDRLKPAYKLEILNYILGVRRKEAQPAGGTTSVNIADLEGRQQREGLSSCSSQTQQWPILPTTARGSWRPQHDNRLIRLVRQFGVEWVTIENENRRLPLQEDEMNIEDRSRRQLIDRAMTLKANFYRYATPLYPPPLMSWKLIFAVRENRFHQILTGWR